MLKNHLENKNVFSCFLNVVVELFSIKSKRSSSGSPFQDTGPTTENPRFCAAAKRQRGTFKRTLSEDRRRRSAFTEDRIHNSCRYDGLVPVRLFQTIVQVLNRTRRDTGRQCKVSRMTAKMRPNFGIRRSSRAAVLRILWIQSSCCLAISERAALH